MSRFFFLASLILAYIWGIVVCRFNLLRFLKNPLKNLLEILQAASKKLVFFYKSQNDRIFFLFSVISLLAVGSYLWFNPGLLGKANSIQFLIFLATLFTLVNLVIIKDTASKFRNRPVIKIKFAFKEPDCHLTPAHIGAVNISVPTYYVRFVIKNSGKTTIRRTEAFAEEVKTGRATRRDFLPLNLIWALTETQKNRGVVSISPGAFKTVDLLKILEPGQASAISNAFSRINQPVLSNRFNNLSGRIGICSVVEPNTLSDVLPAGNHTLLVSVCANNVQPLYAKFSVKYDGGWSNNINTMFSRHLKVRLLGYGEDKDKV